MEPAEAIQQLDLVVGRITGAEAHAGARGPSALVLLGLGKRGESQTPVPVSLEIAESLVGRQVVCAIGSDDVVVLMAQSHDGPVVVQPAQEVEDGTPVA